MVSTRYSDYPKFLATAHLIELLREARSHLRHAAAHELVGKDYNVEPVCNLINRIDTALAQAEAEPAPEESPPAAPSCIASGMTPDGAKAVAFEHVKQQAAVWKQEARTLASIVDGVCDVIGVPNYGPVVQTIRELKEKAAAPAVPADVEDRIEAAYWNFDARRKGYGQWASAPMSERDAFKAELRNALAQPAAPAVPDRCQWTADDDPDIGRSWDSECGEKWSFIDGGPNENNVRFCQGCGKPVVIDAAPEVKP